MRRRASGGIAVGTVCLLASGGGALASPALPTRDQNPLLAGFGLPMPFPSRPVRDAEVLSIDLNWSNTALAQTDGSQYLLVDAETRELRLTYRGSLTKHLAFGLQIPYRYTGAGVLDGFIDGWHDAFGLPQGVRPALARDRIRIRYSRDATQRIDVETSAQGLGDVSADVGYGLVDTASSSAMAWLSLKLPTGQTGRLAGSGAADVTLAVAAEHRWDARWSAYAQIGVTWLGEGDLLPDQQRNLVWSGLAGMSWRIGPRLALKAQADAHSAAFTGTRLDMLGEALILSIGADYRFASGWQLDLGFSEDVAVEASPDIVFIVGVRRSL